MRIDSDEKYVLDLVSEVLKENYEWQKKFNDLLGDPGKSGRRAKLSVDAYFPENNLIVEYREKQHYQPIAIMDKRMTVSGISRGEQRKIYDLRKEQWARDNNFKLFVITYADLSHKKSGKLIRTEVEDISKLMRLIQQKLGGCY
ncbi:hypothetical protein [Oscillibacter sp.]|uniref:hypothetical protein n=1 Tax=Oscillibacter sp. TaxID=1945593 RepID=UPI003394CEDC